MQDSLGFLYTASNEVLGEGLEMRVLKTALQLKIQVVNNKIQVYGKPKMAGTAETSRNYKQIDSISQCACTEIYTALIENGN